MLFPSLPHGAVEGCPSSKIPSFALYLPILAPGFTNCHPLRLLSLGHVNQRERAALSTA